MQYYLQGLSWGLAYVAPIGVQNLFVINTALTQKRSRAFLTALIVVFFDVTLALACFFGIGAVMERWSWLKMAILLIGGGIVVVIGIGLLRSKTELKTGADVNIPILKAISTACVVTWLNPQALIDGSMMLGAFKASLPAGNDLPFILGVASASFTWFVGITALINMFSARFSDRVLLWINRICGVVIIFYGLKLLWNFVQML